MKLKSICITLFVCSLSIFFGGSVFAQAKNGFYFQSNSVSIQPDKETTVVLSLSTNGKETTGADAQLKYDPNSVEVLSVTFSPPLSYPHNFFTNDPENGILKLTSTFTQVGTTFRGDSPYAQITLKGKTSGTSTLSFVCSPDKTNDTNLLEKDTGKDFIDCSTLQNLSISVDSSAPSAPTQPTSSVSGCSSLQSSPQKLTATANGDQSIRLSWTKDPNASSYTLSYGTKAGSYQFGAGNVGNIDSFLLKSLDPNSTYYVALAGMNGCSTSPYVTTQATTGAVGTQASTQANTQDTPSFDSLLVTNTGSEQTIDQQSSTEVAEVPVSEGANPRAKTAWIILGLSALGIGAIVLFTLTSMKKRAV